MVHCLRLPTTQQSQRTPLKGTAGLPKPPPQPLPAPQSDLPALPHSHILKGRELASATQTCCVRSRLYSFSSRLASCRAKEIFTSDVRSTPLGRRVGTGFTYGGICVQSTVELFGRSSEHQLGCGGESQHTSLVSSELLQAFLQVGREGQENRCGMLVDHHILCAVRA